MNKTVSRVLWIIAGALLVIAGVCCMRTPRIALYSLPLIFGLVMLFSGIVCVDIVVFCIGHQYMAGSGWFLVDGILTVLLSIFILYDEWFTVLSLPFIFGMWMIFSGITKFANSFDMQRLRIRGWGWFTALGILMTAVGFLSFMNPFSSLTALAAVIGVFLILQGIVSILRGCFSDRLWI